MTKNGKLSYLTLACQAAILLALVAGIMAFTTAGKSVTLVMDGHSSTIAAHGNSVADVLARADINVAAGDSISPALDTRVEDGGTITVNTVKDIKVTLDGTEQTVTTTSHKISDLISQLGIAANARISAPADTLLAGSGNIDIITPKTVTLIADGKKTQRTTTAQTVGDLLAESKLSIAASDLLTTPKSAPIVENMVLKVTRINNKGTATETVAVPYETEQTTDPNMFKGEKKITREGVAGSVEKTFRTVVIDGKEVSRTEIDSTVTLAAVSAKVSVGTKERPAEKPATGSNTGAKAPAMSNEAMWDAIAQCESTGNWSINTGNGYYGGLQFDIGTWLGAGGGEYAPNASLATKAQQIDIANRVYAQRGLQPWGCAHMVR